MEHEDNAQFENFLQNTQNRIENLHLGSTGVAVVNANELGPSLEAEIVVDAGNNVVVVGQKCDGGERDDDEEEWKYIKEVQQSEKQQQNQQQQQQQQHQEHFVAGSRSVGVGGVIDVEDDDEDAFVVANAKNKAADGNGHQHDSNIGHDGGVGGFVVGNGGSNNGGNGNGSGGDHNEEDELFLKSQQTLPGTHGNGDFRGFGAFSLDDDDLEIINSTTSNTDTTTTNTGSTDEIQLRDIGINPSDLDDDGLRDFLNPNFNSNAGYNVAEVLRQEQLLQQMQRHNLLDDDDEPSSVATTYGTSSLSENQTPFDQEAEELSPMEVNNPDDQPQSQPEINFENFDNENKENADPANIENHRPTRFQSELHSELNPNATEFVPSSPTSAEVLDGQQEQQGNIFGDGTPRPESKDVARRLLGIGGDDDDLVAASPRKGLGENMDAITLPEEIEFEHEADQRPHGAEQDDNLFGGQQQQPEVEQQQQQNQLENGQNNLHEELGGAGSDSIDFQQQRQSPASFIDHGPETSVDLELNSGAPGEDDVMNKSMYGEQLIGDNDTNNADAAVTGGGDVVVGGLSTAAIADILNSVQILPQEEEEEDNLNNSHEEQQQQQQQQQLQEQPSSEDHHHQHDVHDDDEELSGFNVAGHVVAEGSKELLNVEEKEHVSHSPSTEELQLNLQNEMHSSHKDIPQLPVDSLENVNNMQESFYFEHTSSSTNANAVDDDAAALLATGSQLEQSSINETSSLFDTSIPQEANASSLLLNDSSLLLSDDNIGNPIVFSAPAPHDLGLVPETAAVVDITPSPLSTAEEKHLVEDTKEQEQEHRRQQDDEQLEQSEHELVQQMDALLLSGDVGASSQESTEQAAELFTATNVNNIQNAGANPFAVGGEHSKYEFAQPSAAEQAFEGQILLEEAQEEEQKRHDFEHHQQQHEQHADNETPLEAAEPESNVNIEKASEPEAIVAATEEKEIAAAAPIESAPPAVENKENNAAAPEIAVAAATAVAAVAVAATAAAAVALTPSKPTSAKTPSSDLIKKTKTPATSAAKTAKVGGSSPLGARKPSEISKKSTTSATSAPTAKPIAAARPRTAPSTAASKVGSTTTATGSKTSSTTSTRRTLTSSSAATGGPSKVPPSRTTNTTRPATAPATGLGAKPGGTTTRTTVASRLTAARKPATTSATNGVSSSVGAPTAASKARTVAAAKPTTLGVSGNTGSGAAGSARPKLSPRSTLTSQLRKAPPPSASSAPSGSRSPLKSSANSASNKSSTFSSTATTAASRAKGGAATSLTTTTTTTTKTFTARPAPKTTHTSSTLSATRRPYSGGNTTASSTTTTTTTTTRRVSPLKSSSLANKSPTKGSIKSTTPLKTQAKEPIAKSSPNSSLLKGAKKTAVSSPKAGGAAAAAAAPPAAINGQATKDEQQQPAEEQKQNGNGLPHDGDDSLPEPTPPGAGQPDPSASAALLDF